MITVCFVYIINFHAWFFFWVIKLHNCIDYTSYVKRKSRLKKIIQPQSLRCSLSHHWEGRQPQSLRCSLSHQWERAEYRLVPNRRKLNDDCAQDGPNLNDTVPRMGQTWMTLCPWWAKLEWHCAQDGPNLNDTVPRMGQTWMKNVPVQDGPNLN